MPAQNTASTTQISSIIGTDEDDYLEGTLGADLIVGLGGNDILYGSYGDDTLQGGTGDDTLSGGWGRDVHDGGAGNDTVSFAYYLNSNNESGLVINLVPGSSSYEQFINIENVIGTNYDDVIIGTDGANVLDGSYGDDTLQGGAGDDFLSGGWGSDVHDGGEGNDTVSFEYYFDNTSKLGLVIDLAAGGNGYEHFISIENAIGTGLADVLIGTDGANLLVGGEGSDTLKGSDGDDTLQGGEGDDLLSGGWGSDLHDGGEGEDTVTFEYYNGNGTLVIDLTNEGGGFEGFIDVENVIGSNSNDWIVGTEGNNIIESLAGNDTIIGGAGRNRLTGGEGEDVFVFDLSDSVDFIVDFTSGEDLLDLSATGLQFDDLLIQGIRSTTMEGPVGEIIEGVSILYNQQSPDPEFPYYGGNIILLNVSLDDFDPNDLFFG